MNTGLFGEGFPYSNFHDLNMDWIIKIAKDFLDQYTNIQNVIAQGLTDLDDKTTEGITALETKKTELEGLLDQWYNTHSQDIANQLAQATADIATQFANVTADIATQFANATAQFSSYANQVGENVIASIPDDYTALSAKVDSIENCFTTTGTINSVFTNIHIIGRYAHDINFNNICNNYNTLYGFSIRGENQNINLYENYALSDEMEGDIIAVCEECIISFHYNLNIVPTGTRLLQQTGFIVKKECYLDPTNFATTLQMSRQLKGTATDILPTNEDLFTTGKFYGHGSLTLTNSASAMILNQPISVCKGLRYYFANIYAYFSNIVYDDNTIVALSDNVETHMNGYFTPTKNGKLYITLSTATAYIHNIARIRTAPEKWLEVYPTDDIFAMLYAGAGQTIHFNSGIYNIINIYETRFGNTYFNSYSGYTSDIRDGKAGLPVLRGTTLIGSPSAVFRGYYAGSNTSVRTYFSAFALESDVTLDNIFINCDGLRNCVHDDFDNSYEGKTVIKNCVMLNDSIVVAGGLSIHDEVILDSNIFESKNNDAIYDVSYHNSGDSSAKSKLIIKNNHFKTTVRIAWYGESTDLTNVLINGNSMNTNYIEGAEAGATTDNMLVYAWNNEVRGN